MYNHNPLPRIPTKQTAKKSNETSPLNITTRTPRLPLSILNRSVSRSPSGSNAKRTKTASLPRIGNLYSLTNNSGDLILGSTSPIRSTPTRSTPTPIHFSLLRPSPLQIQRRWPPISLLRSRRKLWKKYWFVVNLPAIQEENEEENIYDIKSLPNLPLRSEKPLVPRKPPPLASEFFLSTHAMRPVSKAVIIGKLPPPPPPPELDDDTGSESSSSDEDLDSYEFDLSGCANSSLNPSSMPTVDSDSDSSDDGASRPLGIYDKSPDSRIKVSFHRLLYFEQTDRLQSCI